jgi:hypothetical protein
MFHPSSNKLSGFLEVSALFISLAQSGGVQYKAGYLRFETSGSTPGLGRKATSRRDRKHFRWCAVRESCLVILEEPGEVCCISFQSHASNQHNSWLFWMSSSWTRISRSYVQFVTIAKVSTSFARNLRTGSFRLPNACMKSYYLRRQRSTVFRRWTLSLAE